MLKHQVVRIIQHAGRWLILRAAVCTTTHQGPVTAWVWAGLPTFLQRGEAMDFVKACPSLVLHAVDTERPPGR